MNPENRDKKVIYTTTNILVQRFDDTNESIKLLTPMYSESLSREYDNLTILLKFKKDTFMSDEYFEPLHYVFDVDGGRNRATGRREKMVIKTFVIQVR